MAYAFLVQQAAGLDPEASARAVQAAVRGIVVLLAASVLVPFVQTAIARRFGTRWAWPACLAAAGLLIAYGLPLTAQAWAASPQPLATLLYIMAMFMGAPLVLSTWLVARSVSRDAGRSWFHHMLRGWAGFIGGAVLGAILASLPDVWVLL